jgi:hypothetical protein
MKGESRAEALKRMERRMGRLFGELSQGLVSLRGREGPIVCILEK